MRALVIGCGYLGQRVAARWQEQGVTVYAVTRSASRAEEFAERGWSPLVADVCEGATLESLPAVDVALFAVGFDRTAGRTQAEVYVDGLQRVLDRLRGRCPQVIHISSSSVYGQQAGEWVDEDSPCEPTQPGGMNCLAAERRVLEAAERGGPAGLVLRLSGIYGPERLLSRVDGLRQQKPLAGTGDAWLNLIHVADAAAAVVAAAERGSAGRVWLVSDNAPVRRRDYYGHLAGLIGAPAPTFDASEPARHGAGGLNKRCRNTRMLQELGVTLRYPTYREGLPASLPDVAPGH